MQVCVQLLVLYCELYEYKAINPPESQLSGL